MLDQQNATAHQCASTAMKTGRRKQVKICQDVDETGGTLP